MFVEGHDSSMKNLRDKLICNLVYGGLRKEEYEEIKQEILETERSSLHMASVCLCLMFAGLFVGSLFSELMETNRTAYATLEIFFLGIVLCCERMKKGKKQLVMPLWYTVLTVMFAYAIVLNTVIRNDISATTYCLILIVAPLLILDRPWRVFCYFCIVTCAFIPIVFWRKSYYLAYTDTVNVLCCAFLGSVIHLGIIRTKLREMIQRHYIEQQRDTDKLTGCLNKTAFSQRIVSRLGIIEDCGVLVVMDIDHFKEINDSYGHIFGDMVLNVVGEALRLSFPDVAMCGRFGGDEFQVWLPGTYSKREVTSFIMNLTTHVAGIKTPDGQKHITLSIGIAFVPGNGSNYSELFESADAALYSAKNTGRNRYVFCPGIHLEKEA